MDITPALTAEKQRIERYGAGGFTIGGVEYRQAVLIVPDKTLCWEATCPEFLTFEVFSPLLKAASRLEILLVGTGKTYFQLPSAIYQHLRSHGIATECMDTGAACRTFNVLLTEERRVAAALLPV